MSHDDITPEAESEIFEAMVMAEELATQKKASRIAGLLLHLRLLWIWGLSKNAELTLKEDYEAASRLLGLSDGEPGLDFALGADRPLRGKRGHVDEVRRAIFHNDFAEDKSLAAALAEAVQEAREARAANDHESLLPDRKFYPGTTDAAQETDSVANSIATIERLKLAIDGAAPERAIMVSASDLALLLGVNLNPRERHPPTFRVGAGANGTPTLRMSDPGVPVDGRQE